MSAQTEFKIAKVENFGTTPKLGSVWAIQYENIEGTFSCADKDDYGSFEIPATGDFPESKGVGTLTISLISSGEYCITSPPERERLSTAILTSRISVKDGVFFYTNKYGKSFESKYLLPFIDHVAKNGLVLEDKKICFAKGLCATFLDKVNSISK